MRAETPQRSVTPIGLGHFRDFDPQGTSEHDVADTQGLQCLEVRSRAETAIEDQKSQHSGAFLLLDQGVIRFRTSSS